MLREIKTKTEHYFRDQNGVFSGEYLLYHSNGSLYLKCFYKNGKREGQYIKYSSDGKLMSKRFYRNGIEVSEEEYKIILIDKNLKRIK